MKLKKDLKSMIGKRGVFLILFLLVIILMFQVKDLLLSSYGKTGIGSGKQSSSVVDQPSRNADIYGIITSVKGNNITILKFDLSTMPGAKETTSSEEESSGDSNIISLGSSSTGSMPGSGAGQRSGFPGGFGSSSSSRQDKLEELKGTSIGTETIEVPVGIPILLNSSSQSLDMGSLRDLSSDTLVAMWIEDSDSENSEGEEEDLRRIATYVSVTGKVDMDN